MKETMLVHLALWRCPRWSFPLMGVLRLCHMHVLSLSSYYPHSFIALHVPTLSTPPKILYHFTHPSPPFSLFLFYPKISFLPCSSLHLPICTCLPIHHLPPTSFSLFLKYHHHPSTRL